MRKHLDASKTTFCRALSKPSANIEEKKNHHDDNYQREPSEEACKDGSFTFCSKEDVEKPKNVKLEASAAIGAIIADCSALG